MFRIYGLILGSLFFIQAYATDMTGTPAEQLFKNLSAVGASVKKVGADNVISVSDAYLYSRKVRRTYFWTVRMTDNNSGLVVEAYDPGLANPRAVEALALYMRLGSVYFKYPATDNDISAKFVLCREITSDDKLSYICTGH